MVYRLIKVCITSLKNVKNSLIKLKLFFTCRVLFSINYYSLPRITAMPFIVLNPGFGGFQLSEAAINRLGLSEYDSYVDLTVDERSNPDLVRVCRELGQRASSYNMPFKLVEVSADDLPFVKFSEYDGVESITIDQAAKQLAQKEQVISDILAVLGRPGMSAEAMISVIKTIIN